MIMQVNFLNLNFFPVFLEYFLGVSILYILILCVLLTNNIRGILVQRIISDCFGFILLLGFFVTLNDDFYFTNGCYEGYSKYILMDNLAMFSKLFICLFSSVFFFVISGFLKNYKLTYEFVVLLMFSVLGLIMMCCSNELMLVFLSIELVSLSSYLLASFRKTSSYSVESGIKYLIVGAISSSFFLLGASFLYAYTGSLLISDYFLLFTNVENLFFVKETFETGSKLESNNLVKLVLMASGSSDYKFINIVEYLCEYVNLKKSISNSFMGNESVMGIGLSLIMFSVFIKLSLAPFHLWSLDVYEGSPTIATFFFATITKLSFFIFLFRICHSLFHWHYFSSLIEYYCLVVGFCSVLVGSFGNLRQKKLKTIFAYSSISHMGYLILSFGTCTPLGFEMLIFYLFIYMLSNILIWSTVLTLRKAKINYKNKNSLDLGDIALLNKTNKSLAFGLMVVLLSIAGIPPFVGFYAKFGVFLSLINKKYYVTTVLTVLCSVVSTFYYLRLVKIIYFENISLNRNLYYPVDYSVSIICCTSAFVLIFLFWNPTFLYLIVYKIILFEW